MVRYNGSSLLIDCGEGTQIAIKEKGWSFKPIDVICFTPVSYTHLDVYKRQVIGNRNSIDVVRNSASVRSVLL